MQITFGRYEGLEIREIPSLYLLWVAGLEACKSKDEQIALIAEIERRALNGDLRQILETRYKAHDK
jgi:uncharacterized protein (DUF3820 family)